MDLYQLQQFRVTAELEHMTQAAFRLHVAQPALSRTIRSLERELDMPLFDRKNKSIQLNDNGRVLLGYARQIDDLLDEMSHKIREKNQHDHRTIRILLRSNPPSLMDVVHGFSVRYPNTHFQIASYVENTRIYGEQFDFELGINLTLDETYHSIPMYQDWLSVAVSDSHPLAKASGANLREWEDNTFLLLSFDSKSQGSETSVLDYLKSLQFAPKVILTCTDSQSMYGLIRENLGIGLTCRYLWNETQSGIVFVPIQGEQFSVTTDLAWKKNRPLSPICQAFKSYVMACGEENRTARMKAK